MDSTKSARSACPFCNAELPALSMAPTTPRIACARCGEPVPSERFPIELGPEASEAEPEATPIADRKRATASVLIAIMAGMAVLALVFALTTRDFRRKIDPKPRPETVEPLAENPSQLLGLQYLLPGTNIVLGLHVSALERDDAAGSLLSNPRPEIIDRMVSVLDLVGLGVADVDHVALGCVLTDFIPKVVTVVVTRKPYDPVKVREAVSRHKVNEKAYRKGVLYRITDMPQVPTLWCADPRVLVWTTLTAEDLDRISATNDPLHALTPVAAKALAKRLGKQSRIWAVGDIEAAKDLLDVVQPFGLIPKDQVRLLLLVRSFTMGIVGHDKSDVTLIGDFHTGTITATRELGKLLESFAVKGASSQKVEIPPADVEEADLQWVTWQVRGDPATLRDLIGQFSILPRKGKKE